MRYDKERVEYLLTQEKTPEVVEELVIRNTGLLNKQLYKFCLTDDPDALSIGYEALYNAIMTFDNSKGHRFSTYATVCIYNALGSLVRSMKGQLVNSIISYDAPIDESGRTLEDTLVSFNTADGVTLAACGVDLIKKAVNDSMLQLTNDLHKEICSLWVDSGYTMTRAEIAKKLGCTHSYVSQIITKLKSNIKNKLGEYIQ